MTEEINELACNHCNEVFCSVCENKTCDNTKLATLKCREWRDRRAGFYCGYEQGYKNGYNKANKWHDLRKDPYDLPKKNKSYWVYIDCQGNKIYRSIVWQGCWLGWDCIPLAWCEEPKFEE